MKKSKLRGHITSRNNMGIHYFFGRKADMNTPVIASTRASEEAAAKVSVDLVKAWSKMASSVGHLGQAAVNILRQILDAIAALLRRIAHLFGVDVKMDDVKDENLATSTPTAVFEGEADAIKMANQALEGPLAALVKGMIEVAPNLEKLDGESGEQFLREVLSHVTRHIDELKLRHEALTKEFEPLLLAAAKSIRIENLDEAYAFLRRDDGNLKMVDPKGELAGYLEQLQALEGRIKDEQQAMCAYCAAAFNRENLKPLAEEALAKEGFRELRERVVKMSAEADFLGGDVDSGNNSLGQALQSRNILNQPVLKLVTPRERGEELHAEIAPDVPAGMNAPAGVSRFGKIDRRPVGDMDLVHEDPDSSQKRREGEVHE